ncbi:MAG: hypothetical protein AAFR11_11910 [Pseudomonadota bacterium]
MSQTWRLRVADRIYGPYSYQELEAFAQEGRFAPNSMVAAPFEQRWRTAGSEPVFRELFARRTPAARRKPSFGRRDAAQAVRADPDTATFLIVFDVISGAAGRIETAIRSLGKAMRVADNVWAVTCANTAPGVRNTLAQHLSEREPVLVVDATRGRSAWLNFCPETDAKLKQLWRTPV